MTWFVNYLEKVARKRRFSPNDRVRYFTEGLKGTGRGVVLTPYSNKGTIVDYQTDQRRYKVRSDSGEEVEVHPRNLIPDPFSSTPSITEPVAPPIGQNSV